MNKANFKSEIENKKSIKNTFYICAILDSEM